MGEEFNLRKFFTGRDSNTDYVGENPDAVAGVVNQLNTIATGSDGAVEQGRQKVISAIDALNSTKGMEYITEIPTDGIKKMFDQIGESIKSIANNLSSVASDLEEYSNSAWYEKLGSSAAMAGVKIGEGGLSVGEDIVDAGASVVGFFGSLGGADTTDIENFIKGNWSHDAFNFYYKSDLAKKSFFTEDSALAGTFKIAGSTVGYLALGGVLSGAGGALAAKTAGSASKFVKPVHALGTFASSTTRINTLTASISGLGSGTETQLLKGKDIKDAVTNGGLQQMVIQGGLAYGAGKLGEFETKKAVANEIGNAKGSSKFISDDAAKKIINSNNNISQAGKEKLIQQVDDYSGTLTKKKLASEILNGKDAKLNYYQGYTDKITQSFQHPVETGKNVANAVKGAAANVKANGIHPIDALKSAAANVKGAAANVKANGIHPIDALKSAAGGVKEGAVAIATNPATPGVAVAIGNETYNTVTNGNAAAQFRSATENSGGNIGDIKVSAPDIKEFSSSQISDSNPVVKIKDGSSGGGPTGGGPTGGGPTGGGPTGGGSIGGESTGGGSIGGESTGGSSTGGSSNTTAHAQFRKSGDGDSTSSTTAPPSTTSTTAPPSTTSTTAPPSTTSTTVSPSTTSTTAPTPSTSQTTSTTILTPKNNSNSEQVHTGGGYSSSSGYTGTGDYNSDTSNATPSTPSTPETMAPGNTSKLSDEELTSIKNVIDNSKIHTTTIPKSNTPINSNTKSGGGGSSVIPISAGLTAAAAAGLGAKAYLDRKNNNDNGSSDEINTDEWTGDESVDIKYDDSSDNQEENTLDADDDYSYQPAEETEKYDAKANNELKDLQ